MKKLLIALGALLTLLSLTACPDKGGNKDNSFVTSQNSCFHYTRNAQNGLYYDQAGRQVNCDQGQFALNNGMINPANQFINGQFFDNCKLYGSNWQRINVMGQGYVCVQNQYFSQLPGFSAWQQSWVGSTNVFPRYARSCQVGVNCGGCFGGASAYAGVSVGNLWLGGTLGLCF